jgi:hypothetical protein
MPPYVDVVPLAFVTIDDQFELDFSFLCTTNPPDVIQGWIKEVRANGTKVLLSINDQKLGSVPDVNAFAQAVAHAAVEWGVDGIDFDYEGWITPSETMIDVVRAVRPALAKVIGSQPYLSAPVYYPWLGYRDFLHELAGELDLVTTMDYTPYPGFDETVDLFNQYSDAIGLPAKLAIGISCMGPPDSGNFTPLEDVEKLCKYERPLRFGPKGGAMLYTFSYDVETREGSGTGYPNATFTKTIEANLP